jgi:hypothetical protein
MGSFRSAAESALESLKAGPLAGNSAADSVISAALVSFDELVSEFLTPR